MEKKEIETIVIENLTNITGLSSESIAKIKSDNLFKMGILNSLTLVSLMDMIENKMNLKIDIKQCEFSDFESVNSIVDMLVLLGNN